MATADPADIIRVPGRLVLTPTDLTLPFPHGGTPLGITRDQELRPVVRYHREKAEEWKATSRVLYCGADAVFAAIMRTPDAAGMALAWPETTTGAASATPVIAPDVNATSRAGRALSGSLILFSPIALETHPAVLLFNAVPMIDEAAKLQFSLKAEYGPAVMWACLPGSDGKPYAIGMIGDLVLP